MKRFYLSLFAALLLTSHVAIGQCDDPHTTVKSPMNGQAGAMVNITALNGVVIDSLWTLFDSGMVDEIEIYWRPGSILGHVESADGWMLIDSALNVPSFGIDSFTRIPINLQLQVPQGMTIGLYVTQTDSTFMRYSNVGGGASIGDVFSESDDIQVSVGAGLEYPFGSSFSARMMNCRIFYTCCPDAQPVQGPIEGGAFGNFGDTITYSIPNDSGAVNYTWTVSPNDTILSGQGTNSIQVILGSDSSKGQVCVSRFDSCNNSEPLCKDFDKYPAGIHLRPIKELRIYPNPSDGVLTITSESVIDRVIVINQLGQTVYNASVSESSHSITTQSWPIGIYTVCIENGGFRTTRKLIVR